MSHTIKFYFSFIFLCGIFSTSYAKSLRCDSLYTSGNYFEASIEYERMIFHSDQQSDINYYKYRKALCYKKMHSFDKALNELQQTYFSNPTDTLYRLVSYEQTLCFYLNGEPARALWKIDEFFHRSPDSASFHFFMPVKILCYNETFQWEDARKSFMQYIDMQNFPVDKADEMKVMVSNLYSKKNRPHIKSTQKAENLSRFIPGAGQIYAGKEVEGIVNFLINASVLTFAGFQVYNHFYITGYLAGLGFFNKTYHGGIKRAGDLATRRNKVLMGNFNNEVTSLILSETEQ